MKNLVEILNESLINESEMWVAIEDHAHADHYHSKDRTSYRVVSLETWNKLKNGERSKATYGEHDYYELGRSRNKEEAESFIPKKNTPRKSPVKKDSGVDYLVYTITIGKVSPVTGKTKFDWSIFDDKDGYLYYINYRKDGKSGRGAILYGSKNSLKVGDCIELVDNDSQRKCSGIAGGPQYVISVCKSTKEELDKLGKEHDYFTDRRWKGKNVKWGLLTTWYSIKGVTK